MQHKLLKQRRRIGGNASGSSNVSLWYRQRSMTKTTTGGQPVNARKATTAAQVGAPYGSRREQVLVQALDMFNEQGVGPVSTNHIAAAVGISPGNLYYHFRNKEDIVWALLEAMRSEIRSHFGRQLGGDPFALGRLLFEGGVDIMWRYRFLVEDRSAVRRFGPKFAASGRQFQNDFVDLAVSFFRSVAAKGWLIDRLTDADLRRIAGNLYIISTSGIEFSRNQAGRKHAIRADAEEGLRQAFHFLLPYFKTEALPIIRAQFDL